MIAVIGAGAMGSALAMVHARAGLPVALLGTRFDEAAIEAGLAARPHPALGVVLDTGIHFHEHQAWAAVLSSAERVVLAVSSDGLSDVVAEAAGLTSPDAVWTIATKGWDPGTLRAPSEIVMSAGARRVVVLAGPALAPELVAGAPTAMVCASTDLDAAREVAQTLTAAGVSASVTDDRVGAEVAAAYKNVVAIAVGMCEGLGERMPERVYVHAFANARAAMFARGLQDMSALGEARGGRPETILGLAGSGDLYVTSLGGRNGALGRLLGSGQSLEQAESTIGSTVEGVANTRSALELSHGMGVRLVVAPAVAKVLEGGTGAEEAVTDALRP